MHSLKKILVFLNYKKVWNLLNECFRKYELRTFWGQLDIIKLNDYNVRLLRKRKTLIGLLAFWNFDWCVFLEYICIKKQFRGFGYGHKLLEFIKCLKRLVILEVDNTNYDLMDFYLSCGFVLNEYSYQSLNLSYNIENNQHLTLLSYPRKIDQNEYNKFINELNKPEYNQYRK